MADGVSAGGGGSVDGGSGTEVGGVEFVPEGGAGGVAAHVGLGRGDVVGEDEEQRCGCEEEFHGACIIDDVSVFVFMNGYLVWL